jgi:CDP-diacylglycerol--glycerol-3-phosphate 3-phosphatidyltransferase
MTAFHTFLAKGAAILQAVFLLALFFWPEAPTLLFYAAAVLTAFDLAEEIVLVLLLREWRADVKGLYWLLKDKSREPLT